MNQVQQQQPNQIAKLKEWCWWKDQIMKIGKSIGEFIIGCMGCVAAIIILFICIVCMGALEERQFNIQLERAMPSYKNWHGYDHTSMKWGILDNYTIQNPLADKIGPNQIVVEFQGQMEMDRPHGIGIIRCKQLSADKCPIEFGSVQFQHGKLHGGPMFFKLKNGRRLVFEEIVGDVPQKASILYEKSEDFLNSYDNQKDFSGIVREISQHHFPIQETQSDQLTNLKELSEAIYSGSDVNQGHS
ncbi:hypothetical protein FGO68_gene3533 [Halteria grandinella]|uniref:Uncharacterized protein n=1 Tax=Halteria grandinella TaxID=5974 RepID=A0A8J8T6X2_HALGN|nr:hypothetical protein FGO68_gene3533 [Halteria grandinella]